MPVVATGSVVAADLIGAAMMVPKTYRDPDSETLATFALASLAGALAAGAVGALNPALLLYPFYFCVANGAIALLILRRRTTLRRFEAASGAAELGLRNAAGWWRLAAFRLVVRPSHTIS